MPCLAQEPKHNRICLFCERGQCIEASAIVGYAATILLKCGISLVQLCGLSMGSQSKTSVAEENMMKKKVTRNQFGSWLAVGTFYWTSLTLCSRVVNLIKYPWCPNNLNSLNFQLQNVLLLTFWLCRLASYTCRQTHSQNVAWENYEIRDRVLNRATEKTTLVVARLQSVDLLIFRKEIIGLCVLNTGWSSFLPTQVQQ
jgi:hypothetical protein